MIESIHHLRGRGVVAYARLDFDPVGDLRRCAGRLLELADGRRVEILGVEAFAKLGAPRKGEGVGFLLAAGTPVQVGDALTLAEVPAKVAT
jgi:hypothetical protein